MIVMANEIMQKLVDYDKSKHEEMVFKDNKLKVIPKGSGIGWFSDSNGTFLHTKIKGNFLIETEVEIRNKKNEYSMPKAQFSSAGLLIKKAGSEKGDQSWVMYNTGYQNSFFGREIKVTRMSNGFRFDPMYFMGYKSLSTLYLIPSKNTKTTRLRMAKIGREVRCYYYSDKQWIEERPTSDMEVMGNGIKYPIDQFNEHLFRPNNLDLPEEVEVGIVINPGMNTKNPFIKFRDAYGLFSYFKSTSIKSFNECFNE